MLVKFKKQIYYLDMNVEAFIRLKKNVPYLEVTISCITASDFKSNISKQKLEDLEVYQYTKSV
jgi:hypothetical protein